MTSRITLVTTTCDRPFGIKLMERYIAAQTVQPDQWIVADGGSTPAPLTMGQEHIRKHQPPGPDNLADNVVAALGAARGDYVIFIEDDDFYAPDHIERCVLHLQDAPATGAKTLRYYNVRHRCWIVMGNRGAALCQTAMRRELVPKMIRSALRCKSAGDYCIDGSFWSGTAGKLHNDTTVVGIKGVPGTVGLGIGHRPNNSSRRRWKADPGFDKLREWIGDAADQYVDAYHP